MSGLLNWRKKIAPNPAVGRAGILFAPCAASRRAASADDKPRPSVASRASASSIGSECQGAGGGADMRRFYDRAVYNRRAKGQSQCCK